MQLPKLKIQLKIWKTLVKELNHRGHGTRETGAFLLGDKQQRIVTTFICYNDLDPGAFDSGIIIFNGNGFIPLWEYCTKYKVKVLADVHTHPEGWTGQSISDSRNPMVAQRGHIALILPNFATNKKQLLNGVGIHEFLGDGKWHVWVEDSGVIEFIKTKKNGTK